ncbi:MAG: sortase, partial [Gemmiger sp.]|nr:sortase [Gemmiger sp.]
MKKRSFMRDDPLAYLVVPLAFALITVALAMVLWRVYAAPYRVLVNWFSSTTVSEQPQDLFAGIAETITTGTATDAAGQPAQPESIPKSSITYPANGDRYGEISVEGTNVSAPLYYGDSNSILNKGVGTYKDNSGAGIPGEGKTILLAGHNNTFFNDLQHATVGGIV